MLNQVHDQVAVYRRVLALTDRYLNEESRILDFGCGAGALVYEFRDDGLNARGFDIHDYLKLRCPEDRQFFDILDNGLEHRDMTLDWNTFRLPYADATFDFVLSATALEHVLNLELVVRELARVTKPQGIGIHTFPPRYSVFEQHTFVPFGGIGKTFAYNLFWAVLGIRNQFQKGLSAVETARLNADYARKGTNYPPLREINRIGRKYFGIVRFAPQLQEAAWTNYPGYPRAWRFTKPALLAHTVFDELFWVLELPRVIE